MRVCVAIAAAILMSAGCWTSAGTARSAPSAGANLVTLRMTSPTTGWAVGTTALLRTTDGGLHWQMATPLALGRPLRLSSYGLLTAFLDEVHAWVGVDDSTVSTASQQSKPPTTLRLFRSADGGRHWHALPPLRLGTFYYAHTLTFINRETGWLEVIRNVAAGSVWFDLYRTLDGGGHWRRVLQVGSPHSLPGAPLGCDLCDSSLTFSSRMTVWFTGCWCGVGTGSSFLYVSRNAGRTWRALAVSQPPHRGKITIATLPPILFDPRNGVLPTVVLGSNPGKSGGTSEFFDAYVTHDGGRHWTPTTPVPISRLEGYPAFPYSFPDARHGFFVSGNRLYRTSDGGQHWQARPMPIPLERDGSVQFLDGRRGWAFRPGDTQGRRSILWQTADSGESWKVTSTMMSRVTPLFHIQTSIPCAAWNGACPTYLSLGRQYSSHVSWCVASDVRVAADWQGVNTTEIGGVSFSSRGTSICTLQGRPRLVLYSDGHRLNVRQKLGASLNNPQERSGRRIVVRPGHQAGVAFDWANWCRTRFNSPILLKVTFPRNGGQPSTKVRYGSARHSSSTPSCLAQSRPSTIDVGFVRSVTPATPLP
jgi:photosystem II stability/assembly factor-like uncharacterized protein